MQYSQEHLKTMVYAEFGGVHRVYYGQLENRELIIMEQAKATHYGNEKNGGQNVSRHPLCQNSSSEL